MTRFLNSFEAGTNGVAITAGNSGGGSGQALRVNVTGVGSTLVYSNAHPTRGSMGARLTWVAGGQACLRIQSGLTSTNFGLSFDFRFEDIPTATSELVDIWNVGGDHVLKLFVNADGTVRGRMRNAVSNTAALNSTAGGALVADTNYRLDCVVVPGAGVADGILKWQICLAGSNTPVTGMSATSSAMDAGTTAITDAYWGAPENHSVIGDMYIDDSQWDDAANATFIGNFAGAANTPPTIATPAPQLIQAGSTVTLTAIPSDVDGTIASSSWAAASWPVAASTPTFASGAATSSAVVNALPVPGVYLFTPDTIDNLGAHPTSVTQAIVGVCAADGSSDVRGIRSNAGGWSGTVTDLTTAGNTNFIESPAAPVNAPIILDMNPIKPGDVNIDEFTAELAPSGGAASTCQIEILNGASATVIATRTVSMTGAFVNTPIALTSNENAAFTDHIIWGIRLTANQT